MSENIYISYCNHAQNILISKNKDTLPICRTFSGLFAYHLKIIIKVSIIVEAMNVIRETCEKTIIPLNELPGSSDWKHRQVPANVFLQTGLSVCFNIIRWHNHNGKLIIIFKYKVICINV